MANKNKQALFYLMHACRQFDCATQKREMSQSRVSTQYPQYVLSFAAKSPDRYPKDVIIGGKIVRIITKPNFEHTTTHIFPILVGNSALSVRSPKGNPLFQFLLALAVNELLLQLQDLSKLRKNDDGENSVKSHHTVFHLTTFKMLLDIATL